VGRNRENPGPAGAVPAGLPRKQPPGASELRPSGTKTRPLGASSRQGGTPYPGERGPESAKDRGGAPEGVRPSRTRARCVRKNVALKTKAPTGAPLPSYFSGSKKAATARPRRKQQGRFAMPAEERTSIPRPNL
jgi:hypothetical protein